MSDTQRAGWQYAGSFCATCDREIEEADVVNVDPDGDSTGDGGWIDLTVVKHVECPEDEE